MLSFIKVSSDKFVFLLYIIHISLNFLETPFLKYFYFFEVIVYLYLAFTKKWSELLVPTFIFLMIEGQGRVLSNFNPVIKNIFDIYLIILFLRSYISQKRYFRMSRIPMFFYIMMLAHFIWYVVQLFNYQTVGFIGVLFAAKIYIIPFLFLFMFLNDRIEFEKVDNLKVTMIMLFVLILQAILIFHQKDLGESHLIAISQSYASPIKDTFIGSLFRPFGTSHLPGGISVYVAYTICLCFFFPVKNKAISILRIICILLLIFSCFIMQVRTGLVQLVLVVFFSSFFVALKSRFKYLMVPVLFSTLLFIPIIFQNTSKIDEVFPTLALGNSIRRIEILKDAGEVISQRASFNKFLHTMEEKFSNTPLGLGPGRTGAANAMFVNRIKNDLAYDMSYSWTLDNLFVSLAIDLGVGMIFYTFIVVGFPLFFLNIIIFRYLRYGELNIRMAVSAVATCVILLSCWGAIAIPYNPISFFFWFFVSTAIIELDKIKTNVTISK